VGPASQDDAARRYPAPARDTPDILKTYLENFDSRIIGLTGDTQKIEATAKAFRVYAKKVPGEKSGDYTVDHTGVVYLMDKRGKFASTFNLQRSPQQAARGGQQWSMKGRHPKTFT
jgi:protein SCO1/2